MKKIFVALMLLSIMMCAPSKLPTDFVDANKSKALAEVKKMEKSVEHDCADSTRITLSKRDYYYYCHIVLTIETIYKNFKVSVEDDLLLTQMLREVRNTETDAELSKKVYQIYLLGNDIIYKEYERAKKSGIEQNTKKYRSVLWID